MVNEGNRRGNQVVFGETIDTFRAILDTFSFINEVGRNWFHVSAGDEWSRLGCYVVFGRGIEPLKNMFGKFMANYDRWYYADWPCVGRVASSKPYLFLSLCLSISLYDSVNRQSLSQLLNQSIIFLPLPYPFFLRQFAAFRSSNHASVYPSTI